MPSDYRPWDREEKLGPVPEGGFKPDDPKVIAWEEAHGHDLRLKCLPEFGCQVLGAEHDAVERIYEDALQRIVDKRDTEDASRLIAAKALGDASEYRNTGTVRDHA